MITNKWLWILVTILLVLAVGFTTMFLLYPEKLGLQTAKEEAAYETELFDKNELLTINIIVDETEWQENLANAAAEEYISCDLEINGETFYHVGIRPKGNTSLNAVASDPDSDRYSFKIQFDEYVDGQNCYGLDKLALNNIYADATYMKEYMAYDMMDYLGVAVPLYAFAEIQVNGEPWGLYLAVEVLEDAYAERNFGSDHGQLYKPETSMLGGEFGGEDGPPEIPAEMEEVSADINPNEEKTASEAEKNGAMAAETTTEPDLSEKPDVKPSMKPSIKPSGFGNSGEAQGADLVYTDDDPESYSDIFDHAVFDTTAADEARVIEALKQLNQGENLEECVDVDAMLRYLAANVFVVNMDSYFSNMAHNYYLYEEDGRLTMLPWDYNLAFGGFQTGSSSSAINFPIDTPVSGVEMSERPMIAQLLAVEEYREQYHDYLQQLVTGYVQSGRFADTVDYLDTLIGEKVQTDPSAFYSYDQYLEAKEMLKDFAELRAASIAGQLSGSIPSTTEEQQENPGALLDSSSIDLTVMGSQGGGGGPEVPTGGMGPGGDNPPAKPDEASDIGNDNVPVAGDEADSDQNGPSAQTVPENTVSSGQEDIPEVPTGGMGPGGDNPPDKPGEAGAAVETNMIAAEETDRQNSSKAAVSQVNQVEQDRMASENPESATDPSGEHASFGGNRGAPTSNLSAAWWELAICFVALLLAVAAVACFRRRRI